jgi:hypothetical protein
MRAMLVAVAFVVAAAPTARADQSRTILVDEGGSYDVAVHPDFVTVLYFPDKITKAIASDPKSYEIKSIGDTSLAIRPLRANAKPGSLAIVTPSINVSLVLSIATSRDVALTQVTFKRADVEAALQKQIDAAVALRVAELEKENDRLRRDLDAKVPKVADQVVADRLLQRREHRKLKAIERNDDDVIVRVTEVFLLGDDGYLLFEVQNRDSKPFRIAKARVRLGADDRAGLVRFTSSAAETASEGVIGVVAPKGRGTGIVVLRGVDALVGKTLELVVAGPKGKGTIVVGGIVLR